MSIYTISVLLLTLIAYINASSFSKYELIRYFMVALIPVLNTGMLLCIIYDIIYYERR